MLSQLDKNVIALIATGDDSARNMSLIKKWCDTKENVVRNQQEVHHVHELLVYCTLNITQEQ